MKSHGLGRWKRHRLGLHVTIWLQAKVRIGAILDLSYLLIHSYASSLILPPPTDPATNALWAPDFYQTLALDNSFTYLFFSYLLSHVVVLRGVQR